jgi:hypothetical protein
MIKRYKILCFSCALILLLTFDRACWAQFTDDFSDGEFANNPAWAGDVSKFVVENNQLRLFAPAVAESAYLSTPSASINNAVWEFFVRMDFATSGSNYTDIYLTSESPVLTGSLNGYFVRIGNTTDEVSLYRQTGTTKIKIIDGLDGRVSSNPVQVRVRVIRDAAGNWEMLSDAALSGTFVSEGNAIDVTHPSSNYSGVLCVYTSTRSTSFYFDDFAVTGDPFVDPSQPAEFKDVILTEIFADPSPSVGLPEAEFVELYNRSTKIINLSGWKFTDGSTTATLPNQLVEPNAYIILTPTNSATQFSPYGTVLGIPNFPTLNNAADNLILRRSDNVLIDQISYSDTWYGDDDKKQGGYSLELIDPANVCSEGENWTASEAPVGGTPGMQNSVFANKPDLTGPKLVSVVPLSATEILLVFNEKLDDQLPALNSFTITPTATVTSAAFTDASLRFVKITLATPLLAGTQYTLVVNVLFDCSGNSLQQDFKSAVFGLPETSSANDVVINELLFNPRPFGVDFVEVYNRSTKYLNFKNWRVGNYAQGAVTNLRTITAEDFLVAPGFILVFTTDPATIQAHYPKANAPALIKVNALPAFPDTEGSVCLVDGHGNVIDLFQYTRDYHSAFLRDKEGVSLERISAEAGSNDAANWRSASATEGFATPGYANSNTRHTQATGEVVVTPEAFEPVTGQPDFTQIQYNFEQGGFVANVKIVDAYGRLIKTLANNVTLGTNGFFRWDGDTEAGTKARTGYYVVWLEVFNAHGKVETFRKRVVIASRR